MSGPPVAKETLVLISTIHRRLAQLRLTISTIHRRLAQLRVTISTIDRHISTVTIYRDGMASWSGNTHLAVGYKVSGSSSGLGTHAQHRLC